MRTPEEIATMIFECGLAPHSEITIEWIVREIKEYAQHKDTFKGEETWTANIAQKFLLDNDCADLILNEHRRLQPEQRLYASDVMMMFLESLELKKCVNCGSYAIEPYNFPIGQQEPKLMKCKNCDIVFLSS